MTGGTAVSPPTAGTAGAALLLRGAPATGTMRKGRAGLPAVTPPGMRAHRPGGGPVPLRRPRATGAMTRSRPGGLRPTISPLPTTPPWTSPRMSTPQRTARPGSPGSTQRTTSPPKSCLRRRPGPPSAPPQRPGRRLAGPTRTARRHPHQPSARAGRGSAASGTTPTTGRAANGTSSPTSSTGRSCPRTNHWRPWPSLPGRRATPRRHRPSPRPPSRHVRSVTPGPPGRPRQPREAPKNCPGPGRQEAAPPGWRLQSASRAAAGGSARHSAMPWNAMPWKPSPSASRSGPGSSPRYLPHGQRPRRPPPAVPFRPEHTRRWTPGGTRCATLAVIRLWTPAFPVAGDTGAYGAPDAGSLPTRDAGRHPSLDAAFPAALDACRHPSLDAGFPATPATGRHPSLDAGFPAALDAGRHPSLDTGPHTAGDPSLVMLTGLAGTPPPPVPGALEDDPLTSPSHSR